MTSIYLATAYADGPLLAARVAAELPKHGLQLVDGGDWWAWPVPPVPERRVRPRDPTWTEEDYREVRESEEEDYRRDCATRAVRLLERCESAVWGADAVLVLLTERCGIGTGWEVAWGEQTRKGGRRKSYWMDCGFPPNREIPLPLQAWGVQVRSLGDLAERIRESAQ